MAKKKSFFERLTGTVKVDDDEIEEDTRGKAGDENWIEEEAAEGQLTVDVHQTSNDIIVKAMVAGVLPEDLDVSITRDMVTIKGKREESHEIKDDDYFYKELYWGTFSRTIMLPQEVDVEEAEATENHGLLTIRLPKINKERQAKLKVKSS
ncbi:MAG TPA: Hsp20/alpha crystallin family protein [Candidatus Paceibacterota bacterium]